RRERGLRAGLQATSPRFRFRAVPQERYNLLLREGREMSAPRKRFDLVAGRKYTTRNGEEKVHWINCGEGVEWDDGSITIQQRTVPVGNWIVILPSSHSTP